jgi:mono/diheme cytochrome c family protein
MKTALVLLAVLLLVAGCVAGVVWGGFVNMAATEPHSDFVEWFLVTSRDRSIDRRAADVEVPPLDDPRLLRRGAELYAAHCQLCHGAPGVEAQPLAQGLNPLPPDLHGGRPAEAARIYWILGHGIRMTGMPAYGPVLDPDDLWALTALVRRLPDLSAEDYARLQDTVQVQGVDEVANPASR